MQGSSLDLQQQCEKVFGAMGEAGFNITSGFYAKRGLYGCMGLEITDAESFLYFIYVFLIQTQRSTCFPPFPPCCSLWQGIGEKIYPL